MRIVLTGASGQLGSYLLERFLADGHDLSAWSGRELGDRAGVPLRPVDLTDPGATERNLIEADPALVVHLAALSTIEGVRLDPERGRAVNVEATARLADWCARRGRRLVYTSTDLVFDGRRSWNREADPALPVVAYGRSKRDGERAALAAPGALVTRLSLLYGPSKTGRPSYYDRTLDALRRDESQAFFEDEFRTPLDLSTAAEILNCLAMTEQAGLVHVGGAERLSRFELIRRVAMALGLPTERVHANRQRDMTFAEPRPADVSLDTTRLNAWLPDLHRPTVEEAVRS